MRRYDQIIIKTVLGIQTNNFGTRSGSLMTRQVGYGSETYLAGHFGFFSKKIFVFKVGMYIAKTKF